VNSANGRAISRRCQAHLNGTPIDGQEVSYEVLKRTAEETIQANYELQKATYGTIRLKLSVAKLLRRGR